MFTLKNGTEITFDFSKMTYGQYKRMVEKDEDVDTIITAVSGLTVEQLEALDFNEYRLFIKAFWKAFAEPVQDPNSQSASTSD